MYSARRRLGSQEHSSAMHPPEDVSPQITNADVRNVKHYAQSKGGHKSSPIIPTNSTSPSVQLQNLLLITSQSQHLSQPTPSNRLLNRERHLSDSVEGFSPLNSVSCDQDLLRIAKESLSVKELPAPGNINSYALCLIRIKNLIQRICEGNVSKSDLEDNLRYFASLFECIQIEDSTSDSIGFSQEEELPEVEPDVVPNEVRDWLASTFSRVNGPLRDAREKPRFRSVAHAIRAGIMVDKLFRRMISSPALNIPEDVNKVIKSGIDEWSFDLFEVQKKALSNSLQYVGYELFAKYDLLTKFKIQLPTLEKFFVHLQEGYSMYNNPYHNALHGADVAQTLHYLMTNSKLVNWLTDIEIFASIVAALIHDYEHTGTTNNYHINTTSDLALLYNDRGVLENHHVSAAFRMMRREGCNIASALSSDEYKEFRALIVEMVLSTDMTLHFHQIKCTKAHLNSPELMDKTKALSLLLHCADISHPAKEWNIHYQWTTLLLEEFFRQGDRERELKLPFSPLCDRNNTLVAQSQIGFIDYIVEPSFQILGDMLERLVELLCKQQNTQQHGHRSNSEVLEGSTDSKKHFFYRPWETCLLQNRIRWKKKAETETLVSHKSGDEVQQSSKEIPLPSATVKKLSQSEDISVQDGRLPSSALSSSSSPKILTATVNET